MNEASPTVGLSDVKVVKNQGHLICSFSRQKKNSISSQYYDLNSPHYILMAKGDFTGNQKNTFNFT